MTIHSLQKKINLIKLSVIALASAMLYGCSIFLPATTPPPALFSFDSAQPMLPVATPQAESGAPTVVISVPRAAAGFDSTQIIYLRQIHKLEYFRRSQWVDTPARMLSPLIAAALERSGQFSAIVQSPTSAVGHLRLDIEIVRLQHEFLSQPSRAHFTLRAHLIDTATRQVVAWREFDAVVPSPSDDPYGGVLAANSAVRIVTEELAVFCAQAVGMRRKNALR